MNKMFKFNGMPYKRSGRAGGKSASMIGMLVLLLAALLVLPSCFDDDTETVEVEVPTGLTCGDGTVQNAAGDMCVADPTEEYDPVGELDEGECYMDGDRDGMVQGTEEDECIKGEGGNDSIKGMGGDDDIDGGPGNDTLYGGDGGDTLDGMAGNDVIDGGAGDDELIGGTGDNALDGGDGEDIVIYLGAMRAVVNLNDGTARVQQAAAEEVDALLGGGDDGIGDDTLANIENVKGTHGADIINGNGEANLLKGLDGVDVINGHGGDDRILPNRPAMLNDMGTLVANTAALDNTAETGDSLDGADVVDGGDGSDTINYEGESATVEVDLSAIVDAVGAGTPDDATDDVIAHVVATVDGTTDMIKVVNIGTEDEENIVSTIENVVGGFGRDMLTGDDRSNTLSGGGDVDTLSGGDGDDNLSGGAGDDNLSGGDDSDTLNGGADNDTLDGGDGDDTYMAVEAGDTVTEDPDEGMDTVHYATLEDDADTTPTDESVVTDTLAANVEVVVGTPNVDNLTAANTAVTILGLGGNDNLTGDAGDDTLVGCAGENTLTGAAGDDVFGVFNDGTNADTIVDFAEGDEIHLKGFDAGAVTITGIADNTTQAAVNVGGVMVAKVTSTFAAIPDDAATMDIDETRSVVGALIDALGEDNAAGDAVVRMVEFDSAKCGSN